MKLKKIGVPKYVFKDELGVFSFFNVEVLILSDSTVTPDTFNQESDEYSVSSEEIDRMGFEAARRFFNDKYTKVLIGDHFLTPKEVNGIRMFLDCNGPELGKLLDLDKSSISRILNDKQELQRHTMFLLMEKLKNEIEFPGSTRAFLEKLEDEANQENYKELNIPAEVVAEWIIRKYSELEEFVTNLKLQKLLYYSQGIGLGRYNCKLFNGHLFAWEHGPVVREMWEKYTKFGSTALHADPNVDIDLVTSQPLALKILSETMAVYGRYSAWVLREKTHSESPWLEAKQNDIISDELMKTFFSKQLV